MTPRLQARLTSFIRLIYGLRVMLHSGRFMLYSQKMEQLETTRKDNTPGDNSARLFGTKLNLLTRSGKPGDFEIINSRSRWFGIQKREPNRSKISHTIKLVKLQVC